MDINDKIVCLTNKDNKLAYQAFKDLFVLSEQSEPVYQYMNDFIAMIDNSNSYIRTRGLKLIACNAKWDKENKINVIIDEYFKHIEDDKPIISGQCIQDLFLIAKYKPELIDKILEALKTYNIVYQDSMQSLVYKDREKAIQQIKQLTWKHNEDWL